MIRLALGGSRFPDCAPVVDGRFCSSRCLRAGCGPRDRTLVVRSSRRFARQDVAARYRPAGWPGIFHSRGNVRLLRRRHARLSLGPALKTLPQRRGCPDLKEQAGEDVVQALSGNFFPRNPLVVAQIAFYRPCSLRLRFFTAARQSGRPSTPASHSGAGFLSKCGCKPRRLRPETRSGSLLKTRRTPTLPCPVVEHTSVSAFTVPFGIVSLKSKCPMRRRSTGARREASHCHAEGLRLFQRALEQCRCADYFATVGLPSFDKGSDRAHSGKRNHAVG